MPARDSLDLALDAALDAALLTNRVRREYRLPHSVRDEVQRLGLRVIAALQGHDLPRRGTLTAEDAEAAIGGLLDALRQAGIPPAAIAAIVTRLAERSAGPIP
ncbi:MAG: hypothetical protein HKM95_11685, partial [Inquilinus sp.]|nr:hypothetical protein [Inquilinus sp.]